MTMIVQFLKDKKLWVGIVSVVLVNLVLYLFVFKFHGLLPFNKTVYKFSAHHYFKDSRIDGGEFNFLRSLGQEDAQWYLKIASEGYPKNPKIIDLNNKGVMDGLTYNFFPLYPTLIFLVNIPFKNVELAAFILANLLMIVNVISLYFIGYQLFDKKIALKAVFLVFLFPFSVFFRGYFAENIQLLCLLWFSYFLIRQKLVLSAIALGLLVVTKGNNMLLLPLFIYFVLRDYYKKKIKLSKTLLLGLLPFLLLLLWIFYCLYQTGDPLFFYKVRAAWLYHGSLLLTAILNLGILMSFPFLFIYRAYFYEMVGFFVVLNLMLLYKSKKFLTRELWWITAILCLTPVIFTVMDSFTRYQIVFFPLFLYLAKTLKGKRYFLTLGIFTLGLFIAALYFVNWYWIG
jgi:hypothetical protein